MNQEIQIEDRARQAKAEYMREYMKEWRKKNPEKIKESQRRYWEKKFNDNQQNAN
ncbi:hypothetical protein AB4Z22_00170 [Paenibacillus sp. TAF58]